eukprot:351442-Chlamydomonas_euryale.AAC.1
MPACGGLFGRFLTRKAHTPPTLPTQNCMAPLLCAALHRHTLAQQMCGCVDAHVQYISAAVAAALRGLIPCCLDASG